MLLTNVLRKRIITSVNFFINNFFGGLFIMKKIIALALSMILIVCALLTAGCNDNGGETEGVVKAIDISLTDELYAFGVAKDDAELLAKTNEYIAKVKADGTLDAICEKYFGEGTPTAVVSAKEDSSKDQLIIATNSEFAPFEYKEGSNYFGIDMELAKGLADYLGKELVIKDVDFEAVCTTVESGHADIAIAGLTVNETRKESVTFSDSYYVASQVLIVKADDTSFDECKTAEDVLAVIAQQTGKIGGQSSTTAQYYVQGDEEWEFPGIKNMEWVGYTSGALAVNDMLAGNIKYVMIDKAPALTIVDSINAVN